MTASPQRIGLYGGAFDPPHGAHVALARAAVGQLRLDRLVVLPTGQAWHKARTLSAAQHRLAMACLAFEQVPNVVVDPRELRRPGATYTIDTLREIAAEHPGATLFLVMGEDQAAGFAAWREWQAIAGLAELAVAHRAGGQTNGIQALQGLPGVRMHELALPDMPDSATAIRARAAAGEDISQLVAPGVASYIERHRLYGPT